jgi:HK97 family phage prohead protease
MAIPNAGMKAEAEKGLDWREEFGRGGTRVGAVRARQIVAGENLADSTIKRMFSFFSRHEVDKEAEGFSSGEEGYPSNGRIAWALWGGDAGFAWSRRLVEKMKKEEETRAVSGKALETIKNKVEEHNEEVGDVKSKRTTIGVLSKVYERGIGAFKTNPASVRPSVSSPEQWAIARINSFLYALRNGRFRSGKHDTDLLPEGHPLSTKNKEDKSMENKEDRHILNVEETDDTYVISFAKHEDMMEEMEDDDKDMESRPFHYDEEKDEEERLDKSDIVYRTLDLSRSSFIDEEKRRVRIGVSSEEPVERDFGMEVISHSEEDIDTSFIGSGRSPLLLDHDMTKQIGVVERYEIDSGEKSAKAIVRFGRSELAEEIYQDVKDGIRQNISVGYKINSMERVRSDKDDKPMFRVQTTPLEVSVVSVPADQSQAVGVGRSEDKQTTIKVKTMTEEVKNEINLDEVRQQSVAEAKAEFVRNSKEIIDLAVNTTEEI